MSACTAPGRVDRRSAIFAGVCVSFAENPFVYDAAQALSGRRIAHRRLGQELASAGGETVLDVGAGTGSLARVLRPDAFYWALDNDPVKLRRLSAKVPDARLLECSALDIELPDKAVDWTVCVAVAHHMNDEELSVMFSELARVTRRRLVFLDPLASSGPGIASLLWRYDRGSYPRSAETLLAELGRRFEIDRVDRFRVFHRYVLCGGRPLAYS
ncbi:MAG: class I SAM-dependent methyltransferase [Solirubrobacteraceae bacterium]